ncbi:MAG: hypothetical protein IPJ75_01420 [Ignavibacteriales bacterium]|nr:hypothetical protein [Ignavibacteriales bacterium]
MARVVLMFLIMAGAALAQHFIPFHDKQTTEYKDFLKLYKITTVLEQVISTDSTFVNIPDPSSETLFTFDENGNLLTAKFKAFNYVLSTVDSFVYNKAGKLQTIVSYTIEGHASEGANITTILDFVYSKENGQLSKVLHKETEDGKTKDCGSYDYEYNKNSTLKQITDNTKIVFMEEVMPQCNYIFDDRGNLVKEDSKIRTATHEYDSNGKIVKSVEIMEGLDPYTTTYSYDKSGTLLKKKTESSTTFGDADYMYAATGVLSSIQEKWIYGYDIPTTYLVLSYWYNVN